MIRLAYTERCRHTGVVHLFSDGCPQGPGVACATGAAIDGHSDGVPETRALVLNKCPFMRDKTDIEEREYVCCSHDWPDQRPSGMWPLDPPAAQHPVEDDGSSNLD